MTPASHLLNARCSTRGRFAFAHKLFIHLCRQHIRQFFVCSCKLFSGRCGLVTKNSGRSPGLNKVNALIICRLVYILLHTCRLLFLFMFTPRLFLLSILWAKFHRLSMLCLQGQCPSGLFIYPVIFSREEGINNKIKRPLSGIQQRNRMCNISKENLKTIHF